MAWPPYRLTAVSEKRQLFLKIWEALRSDGRLLFPFSIAWPPIIGGISGKAVRTILSLCYVYHFRLTAGVILGPFPYRCFFNDFNDLTALPLISPLVERPETPTRITQRASFGVAGAQRAQAGAAP